MIILWVKKRKEGEKDNPDDKESFRKHDEIMKKFRVGHPGRDVKIVPAKDILSADGNLLAPVDSIKLGKNKQN